jgi:hypothetical protein
MGQPKIASAFSLLFQFAQPSTYKMEAHANTGHETTGMIPAALLNWMLHFNLNDEKHVHHMVYTNPDTITSGTRMLCFHCYTCCTKYNLNVLNFGNDDDVCTCPNGPVHHLHISIVSGDSMELPMAEVEIKCCLCNYYAILSCQSPPISKNVMNTFIKSLVSTKLAIDTLKMLYKLLDNASRDKRRKIELNDPRIVNIRQTKHGE